MRNRNIACMLVALTLVTAACNSTNRLAVRGPKKVDLSTGPVAPGEGALVTDTTLAPASATASVTVAVGGAKAGTAAVKPGATTPTTFPGTPTAVGLPSAGFTGPGVTAKEIRIGLTLVQSGTIFGDVTGVPVDFGDTKAQANAVVDYVNKHGGIAGRTVKPVYYTFDLGRPGLADGQSEQEACAAWTEDNRVFAGFNSALARQALLICLAQRGVPAIHDGMGIDEKTLDTYRNYWYAAYGGAALTLDRLAANEVRVFSSQGLLTKNSIVGIEHFDDPAYKRVVDEVFKPELAKLGITKVVTQPAPRGGIDGATTYATTFRREGVNVVLFLGEGALYPLFFMRAADNQQYFPKYGLQSDQSLGQLLQPGAPSSQLVNAKVMGWTPAVDVDSAHDPGPVSARNALCLDIQKAAGQDMSNRGALVTALGYCDGLFMYQDVLKNLPQITTGGLANGIAALGTSYAPVGVFATRFSRTRPDGADGYRDMKFTANPPGCGCFTYTSPTKPFPA